MSRFPLLDWPDSVDGAALALLVALIVGLPALGYVFLVLDVRAYLRSLRRQLVRLAGGPSAVPNWAIPSVPPCLDTFGLQLPCTEEDLKAAYRERVKQMHPDRGGDRRRFLKLQQHFEESLNLVRETNAQPERLHPEPRASAARQEQNR